MLHSKNIRHGSLALGIRSQFRGLDLMGPDSSGGYRYLFTSYQHEKHGFWGACYMNFEVIQQLKTNKFSSTHYFNCITQTSMKIDGVSRAVISPVYVVHIMHLH